MQRLVKAALLGIALPFLLAAVPAWNSAPWLADLAQMRGAIERDYPNLEWLTGEREVSLDRWFSRAADAIRASHSDADALRVLDRLVDRFQDGHLVFVWPTGAAPTPEPVASIPAAPMTKASFCKARGYDAGQVTIGIAAALPGYLPIDGGSAFSAGLVNAGDAAIGVVRIGVFSPQGYPALCEQAVADARILINKPCGSACEDDILTRAYTSMTRGLITTVERLRAAGAQVLLVDLTRNGGGSEWAEAAARIVSPIPLRSARTVVIRGDAWVKRWQELAIALRAEAGRASRKDRTRLLDYAGQANAIGEGLKPCSGCSRLAPAGYASGLLAELPAGTLAGRDWAVQVFSAAQFPYADSVWKRPVIVLVDDETWSAAEQFAALLQDNGGAVIMGTRTGGAGCGHIDGNAPIVLANSGARLEMPNCVRLRKDDSNEVSGIVPDVPTGVRWNDGAAFAGRVTATRLPEAVAKARALPR